MKNNNIKNINDLKKRIKLLYEYKMVDLNPTNNNFSNHVNENESEGDETKTPPSQTTQPIQNPSDNQQNVENKPIQQNIDQQSLEQPKQPEPVQQNNTELMSFLKNEMSRLDNVLTSINNISLTVQNLGHRLDNFSTDINKLTKSVEEVREPSSKEKLEMRSFDSYPYNKNLNDVWSDIEKNKEDKNGIRRTEDGYEMDYIPMKGMNYNNSNIDNEL